MNKAELLNSLQEANQQWQLFLDQIDLDRMEIAGVTGSWSIKDIIAHLTSWNRRFLDRFQAAQRGEAAPAAPWPAQLDSDDAINAWIYEANRERSLPDVLYELQQTLEQLFASIENLSDAARIETVTAESGRVYNLVWFGEERFLVSEFFDHFNDDHKPDIEAWLAQ